MNEKAIDLARYDFRRNLIVDRDNPILVMKAWRDHLPPPDPREPGQACLSLPNSEEALIWNLFRSLEKAGPEGYAVVSRFFGTSPVERLLFWGCDLEHQGEEQQILNLLLRLVDGNHGALRSEPDLVIISEGEVLLVDCQLNRCGSGSPWRAGGVGAERQWQDYRTLVPVLGQFAEWRSSLRLIRLYVYALKLAEQLGKQPKLGAVLSEKNPEHLDLLDGFYEPFRQFDPELVDPLRTWQRMVPTLEGSSLPEELRSRIVDKLLQTLNAAA